MALPGAVDSPRRNTEGVGPPGKSRAVRVRGGDRRRGALLCRHRDHRLRIGTSPSRSATCPLVVRPRGRNQKRN